MEPGALAPYESALVADSGPTLALHAADGTVVALEVARWLAPTDACDETVLDRCAGPVLDVGCGPGRFVSALTERGVAALGVDIAETAVALARRKGLAAMVRSVFSDLPGEGRWPTVLLMDGNIGIGGDPARLLRRISRLLAPGGRLIVETPDGIEYDEVLDVRFTEHGRPVGPVFTWARVGTAALAGYAEANGYSVGESWAGDGRRFTVLVPRPDRPRIVSIR